jgi:hypothetical protein
MSHGSEEGENYWPGYVDALTSMVQVLAFVMMMLAMAVFSLSQNASKKAVEAIAKAVNAEIKPDANVKQLTQSVIEHLDRLRGSAQPNDASTPDRVPIEPAAEAPAPAAAEKLAAMRLKAARSQPLQAAAEVPLDAPRLTVNFTDRSFRIESDEQQSIGKFIDEKKAAETGQTIVVNAYAYSGEGAISEARRLAYYRAMMARKQLIDAKIKPPEIRINVNDTADKGKGLTVELIVTGSAR